LLVAIWEDQLEVIGLLHPVPTVPLNYRIFGEVPFLRTRWPIEGNTLDMEWVVGHPGPSRYDHHEVKVTEAELRGTE
jgi:hypothetical protein